MADPPTDRPSSIPPSAPRGRPFVARSGPPSRPPLAPRDACALRRWSSRCWSGSAGWPEPARRARRTRPRNRHRRPPRPRRPRHAHPDPAMARRADRPRFDGHVLRPRLRPRRRDVAVRRTRARARRAGARRTSSPTTTAGTTLGTLDPAPAIRVLVLSRFKATQGEAARHLRPPHRPGPSTGSTRVFPPDAELTLTPTTKTTKAGTTTTWRRTGVRHGRREAPERGGQEGVRHPRDRPRRSPAAVLEADHVRPVPGHAPGRAADDADGERRQPSSRSSSTCAGVVPAEMPSTWPAAALQAQAIASRSYAARKLRPGRLLLRHGRRLALAGLPRLEGRARDDERRDRGDREPGPAQGRDRRQHACTTRPAAAPPRTTRTSTRRRPARRSRARSATCAARWTVASTGPRTTTRPRTRRGRCGATPARASRPGSPPTRAPTSAT